MPTDLPPIPILVAVIVGGYLLGSIPFGLIATRLGGAGDIRKVGSGNIGATNVLRTGRRDLAAITLIGDGGKGALAVGLAYALARVMDAPFAGTLLAALAGGAAFCGHVFPVWLRFRGGKGVATFFGVLLAAAWPVGLMAGGAWIAMAGLFRWSSLSALTAAALAPLFALAIQAGWPIVVLAVAMAIVIFIRHRENIARLIKGDEPRIGARKPAPPTAA
ncbi:MAG TPA: glycerol-3-phosphate 1-O-acyltransferase PlsY [Caulobacteraceae bacterium]|jgi:glycerol-3-phosphate acyltransferase PlsY|nr:glycerol-3-phosphate 1-O-acyltransferase PlsY [Caulobacteraceae bacterium]